MLGYALAICKLWHSLILFFSFQIIATYAAQPNLPYLGLTEEEIRIVEGEG